MLPKCKLRSIVIEFISRLLTLVSVCLSVCRLSGILLDKLCSKLSDSKNVNSLKLENWNTEKLNLQIVKLKKQNWHYFYAWNLFVPENYVTIVFIHKNKQIDQQRKSMHFSLSKPQSHNLLEKSILFCFSADSQGLQTINLGTTPLPQLLWYFEVVICGSH